LKGNYEGKLKEYENLLKE